MRTLMLLGIINWLLKLGSPEKYQLLPPSTLQINKPDAAEGCGGVWLLQLAGISCPESLLQTGLPKN